MKAKRHHFILFEVFLSIALISISIISLTSYPYKIYRKEILLLESIELEIIKDFIFTNFISNISNNLCWNDLFQKKITQDLGTYKIKIENCEPIYYAAKLNITNEDPKKNFCLIKCTLKLTPNKKKCYVPDKTQYSLILKKEEKKTTKS